MRFGNITRAVGAPSLVPRLANAVVLIGMAFLTNIRLTNCLVGFATAQARDPREQRVGRVLAETDDAIKPLGDYNCNCSRRRRTWEPQFYRGPVADFPYWPKSSLALSCQGDAPSGCLCRPASREAKLDRTSQCGLIHSSPSVTDADRHIISPWQHQPGVSLITVDVSCRSGGRGRRSINEVEDHILLGRRVPV
jgi:hypothetical protein